MKKSELLYLQSLSDELWELLMFNFDYCMENGIDIQHDVHYCELQAQYKLVNEIIDKFSK